MFASIATFICAAAMALSLSVEAGSFFHARDGSTSSLADASPGKTTRASRSPAPEEASA